MRVKFFSEFILESETIKTPEQIARFLDDGYKIRVIKKTDDSTSHGILTLDENPHSVCLSYGKDQKFWIPKEVVDCSDEGEEIVVYIHPEKMWICNNENRDALEKFLESFLQHKYDHTKSDDDQLEEIKDDLYTILDALGLEFEITKVQQKDPKNYQIDLKDGGCVDLSRNHHKGIFDVLKFYRNIEDGDPVVIVRQNDKSHQFECFPEDLGTKSFDCELGEVPKNPYYKYLVRKSLGMDTHGDGEDLLNYFVNQAPVDSKKPTIDDKENDRRKFFKELKSVVSSYVPEDKLRSLLPSPL